MSSDLSYCLLSGALRTILFRAHLPPHQGQALLAPVPPRPPPPDGQAQPPTRKQEVLPQRGPELPLTAGCPDAVPLCPQVHYCASTGTTRTVHPSGLEVVRFPDKRTGQ
ncbi:hypothetical protein MDA_GLEAN10011294 [Myotis davidii]|uniref:Uncharacterized protein n=1 Tax=Myotis davidii TaxID=225400 RepID=L5MDD2_MYODS|nr:hypothetical protein MDA_GLEAN10011294 [Myotis davidii]